MNPESKYFPFGSKLHKVEQINRSPKKVFILGVYASAVHAQWLSPNHKVKVRALAVASEPYIFWRGENAVEIISNIQVPSGAGYLEPANKLYNGPSGQSLDKDYLVPLGLTRNEVWLADMLPYSCLNPIQWKAIENEYKPLIKKYQLPEVTIDRVPRSFANDARREQILEELHESKAQALVLLGDKPIKQFLKPVSGCKENSLAEFVERYGYGQVIPMNIMSKQYNVIPLVHPRQAASLGRFNPGWYRIHQSWVPKAI